MESRMRLKKNKDFKRIYSKGKSFANRELVLFFTNNNENETFRLGISVSKKVGKAVVRNRVKRLIKEGFRSLMNDYNIPNNLDLIIIARNPTSSMNYAQMERSVKDLLRKSKLIKAKE